MKQILTIGEERLTTGSTLAGDVLTLPAGGGGIRIPEVRESRERWLNITLEVLEEHAQAFELQVYGEEETPRVIIRFGMLPGLKAVMATDEMPEDRFRIVSGAPGGDPEGGMPRIPDRTGRDPGGPAGEHALRRGRARPDFRAFPGG